MIPIRIKFTAGVFVCVTVLGVALVATAMGWSATFVADSSWVTPEIFGRGEQRAWEALPSLLAVEAGLLVLMSTVIVWRATQPIGRSAADAVVVADRFRAGDLGARMKAGSDDEFGVVAGAFNSVADQLVAALTESRTAAGRQARFVADVSHELRTPTAALLASATALEDPSTRDEAAVRIAPQLRRLSNLTENLLELSRLDAGRAPVIGDDVDLADLAREVAAESGDGVQSLGEPVEVRTDPVRVRSILTNLVSNAQRYGRPPVLVEVGATESGAEVSVTDDGDGVPVDVRDRVFERFVRGDASRHGEGSGLGLAIARENARLLEGDLTLDADGRTFRLRLPRAFTG